MKKPDLIIEKTFFFLSANLDITNKVELIFKLASNRFRSAKMF